MKMNMSDLSPICGVYAIKNIHNNKVYIGQSIFILSRWTSHIAHLINGIHSNAFLLKDFQKYGFKAFEFTVLEECSGKERFARELYWARKYFSDGAELYNMEKRFSKSEKK